LGVHRSEHSLEIDAPPQACFEVLVDYESFPRWQNAVESIDVLDRHADGRGRDVQVAVDAKFRKVTYTLRYSYEHPGRIAWDYVEGDVAHVEGEYLLEPIDGGERTRATYRLGIDPGVPVPSLVIRRLNGAVMKRSVEDLRDEVKRRGSA
jgi:uncharacterized membrane protein